MAIKYDSFIELTPGYESVVDISSDSRNADFWSRYIVNDDMVTAVRLLAKSLRPDDPNEDVWHYWIKGSYGTGKTYSAIVIKHLLQDDYQTVENFLRSKKEPEDDDRPHYKPNEIYMSGYKPFCPYRVDLDFYKEARNNFDIHEWIDVIISAVDYNPSGYVDADGNISEETKLFFLRRLLPFVEKRVNIIELAPKGTGKSYVYEKISKRGWLISGGTVSRASLIYDNAKKTGGLLTRFDYVGFDEVQSITFEQPGQIQQALKHYMEFGEIKGFDAQMSTEAGVIVLGNIDAGKFDINQNMVENISEVFGESATLDRFHGFIPGWKIPRLNQDLIANGWAINTEYFAEVLHAMRDDLSYSALVAEIAVGNVFFNWIFGFDGKVRIKAPEDVKQQYKEQVLKAAELI